MDIHFHGAFGIDLVRDSEKDWNDLSDSLWKHQVAAFCPTTLSLSRRELLDAVSRLGGWIENKSAPGARPLGIHLEGPFLASGACGAHPKGNLRPFDPTELEALWEKSRGTLKILTLAPELLSPSVRKKLVQWCARRKIRLAAGHCNATEAQASEAFEAGFKGVTHAWNAMKFHHREAGLLGAALGRADLFVELICDQIHVSPTVMDWTLKLHPKGLCIVSDCVPAARTPAGSWHSFGELRIRESEGACRLQTGALAGGAKLPSLALAEWFEHLYRKDPARALSTLERLLPCFSTYPLEYLGLSPRALNDRRIRIALDSKKARLRFSSIKT